MSKRRPTKTAFNDLWRDDALCLKAVAVEPSMATAWDNVDDGENYVPDPQEDVARALCINACPVRERCLRDALRDNEAEGIRGGFRFENGAVSSKEGRAMFKEFGLRARIIKRQLSDVPNPEM